MTSARVLVVEDTEITALDIASRLASSGYAVEGPISSGRQAVQRVSTSQPDLVLMDIRLSGEMDGVEAAAEIRARYGTPVIYLTAYADDETLRRAKATDPYGYVGKPIVWEELFSTIEVALDRHHMERRLRESEERYRDFVEGTYDLVARLDSDQRFSFVNRMAKEFLGLDPEACIGVSVLDFIHPEDRARTSDAMASWVRDKLGRATLESRVLGRGGQIRDTLWSVSFHYDPAGKVAFQNVIARDITERKRAEEALRRTHHRLEQLVERQTEDLVTANQQIERQIRELLQRNRELALINHAVQAFGSTLDLDQVLTTILEQVRHALDVGACSVWLLNPDREELVGFQASGYRSEIVRGWRLAVGQGIAGWVAQTGESLIVADVRLDDRHFAGIDRQMDVELRSILSVPLKVKERVIGVLQVLDEATNRFCTDDLRSVEPLAASAASAIENARLYEETEALKTFSENIVQSMEEGILIEDEDGRISFCNRKAAELLAYSQGQLVGRTLLSLVAPELRNQVRQERATWSDQSVAGYETALVTRHGARFPVLIGARSLYESGRFTGLLCVFTDITQRRIAEEALRRQNQQLVTLNAIATTIGQMLNRDQLLTATLSKVLEMLKMSAGWIHLIERADGDRLTLVAHQGIKEHIIQELGSLRLGQGLMARVIREKEPQVISGALGTVYGQEADAQRAERWTLAAVPIQARDVVLGVLNVSCHGPRELSSHDLQTVAAIGHQIGMAVENLRLLDEASEIQILRESDRFRSELIANVSHELRTPLGLIKIFSTTLMREDVTFDREVQLEFLHDIELEADKLEEIVSNLLDVSRMDGGRLRLDRRPTDLGELVAEIVGQMESQLTIHQFAFDFPPQLLASIDRKRIAQVLRNLLSNAIKYSPDGGTISVEGRRDGGEVVLQVSDEGIGIEKSDLERVFERFYRVENEVTRQVGGVGLGLAVCQGIVEAHNGRIWVESNPGEGSSFYLSLPIGIVSDLPPG